MKFDYKDPVGNFDRQKVKGVVARLIEAKKPETNTALETAAGDRVRYKIYKFYFAIFYQTLFILKLNYIVVDTETTGKQLLDKGELKRRVTFIPLNKISTQMLSQEVVKRAKKLVWYIFCILQ